jgi:hypothetical protein
VKLYIQSNSKQDKFFTIEKNNKKEVFKAKADLLEDIKETLQDKNLQITDFNDFVAVPTESFTGYRQAVNITNTLKYFVAKKPISSLTFPKYHKEPNINIKNS